MVFAQCGNDVANMGNCVSESEPRQRVPGNRHESDRSAPLEAGIAAIALMLLTWAMRR